METTQETPAAPEQAATKPERIVFSIADQRIPGMAEKRMAEAQAAVAEFVVERPESFAERKFREYGERTDVPTVSVADSDAFLKNLSKIASGQIRAI